MGCSPVFLSPFRLALEMKPEISRQVTFTVIKTGKQQPVVGWEYDSKDFFYYNNLSYIVNTHKGWGRIKIGKYSNKSGVTESTSAVGSYFHKYGVATGSLSFSPAPSIGISFASGYDQFADATTNPFSWTNYNY